MHYELIYAQLCSAIVPYTYSGRKNVMRTASKQKALAHTAVIKLHVVFRLLFAFKHIYNTKIYFLAVDLFNCQTAQTGYVQLVVMYIYTIHDSTALFPLPVQQLYTKSNTQSKLQPTPI